jgi:hypothetical protein
MGMMELVVFGVGLYGIYNPDPYQSRRSPKEKSTDVPAYARGYERELNENCHDYTISVLEQQFGKNQPKVFERGPGSDYSKIKKNCERGC